MVFSGKNCLTYGDKRINYPLILPEIQYKETKDKLKKNFPSDNFEYTSAGSFDYTSSKINELLKEKADELKNIALEYIRKELT